ncbi:MAG: 2OG-Fe(II) oxygenase [Bacteroidetes bacterium]|nr:MAG: 2OG-Fe(II) oxygenase [Bacteroidota bacterium]PTM13051.1 MAG: 2OG-Fe(II) oxygenase [Bacteroidota bacterium]
MSNEIRPVTDEQQFELLIEGLIGQEYGCCDHFFPPDMIQGLRENLLAYREAGLMHPAGVGKKFDYQKNTAIRGDAIYWIDKDAQNELEARFIQKIEHFIQYLNASCYTNIDDYEFHYAYYEPNSFYRRHLDQFKSDRGRQYSLVIYLNDNWQATDGGSLSLYIGENTLSVSPEAGRVVFFKSDQTEHEVHAAPQRPRLSIAGWLKRTS